MDEKENLFLRDPSKLRVEVRVSNKPLSLEETRRRFRLGVPKHLMARVTSHQKWGCSLKFHFSSVFVSENLENALKAFLKM